MKKLLLQNRIFVPKFLCVFYVDIDPPPKIVGPRRSRHWEVGHGQVLQMFTRLRHGVLRVNIFAISAPPDQFPGWLQ